MITRSRETGPVLIVDCPICDDAAPLDAARGALDCETCGVSLEIAADEPLALAAAA